MVKIVLIDFSQLIISRAMEFKNEIKRYTPDFLRPVVIKSLFAIKSSLIKGLDDELVVCFDSKDYWRKKVFPLYKKNRKQEKERDKFDWNSFYQSFDLIKNEIKNVLPFKFIEVDGAEADDIIYTLSVRYAPHKEVIIVGTDKDLFQIVKNNPQVKIFCPIKMKFVKDKDYDLFEHIVKGDVGDGIPNIFSDDDVFLVKEKRQTPIRKSKIIEWKNHQQSPEYFCKTTNELERYHRNKKLIDLSMVPEELKKNIVDVYEKSTVIHGVMFNYLFSHGLINLL